MSPVPWTMQLRSATAKQILIKTPVMRIHWINKQGERKIITLPLRQHRSGQTPEQRKRTLKTTTRNLVHNHERILHHNKRALRIHMTNGEGRPKTLTFVHEPKSGIKLRLRKVKRSISPAADLLKVSALQIKLEGQIEGHIKTEGQVEGHIKTEDI
ncbi:hypothetical protein M436DRAFT_59678 [Aureobasidium namibiae CBS 147.97]|uniref:Uncharacterized protein n=1 Tax=Aureobasidium namibiae CBS 147.97 TaxID=1043004 RepID=A0A074X6Q3_9PEZI